MDKFEKSAKGEVSVGEAAARPANSPRRCSLPYSPLPGRRHTGSPRDVSGSTHGQSFPHSNLLHPRLRLETTAGKASS